MEQYYKQFDSCIQREVPYCQASCPFHLELSDFIEKVKRGAFDAAYKTYKNAVAFPAIVSALCHEPCQLDCPMGQGVYGGSAIELRGLERTIIAEAKNQEPVFYNLPLKNRRVAIIGAGISGLGCALRLTARKYEVEIFEASDRMGGHLWQLADGSVLVGGLTPETFLKEFNHQLSMEAYTLHYNTEVKSLEELAEQGFSAAYVATGERGNQFGLLDQEEPYRVMGDMACYAGGSLLGKSTIEALADGLNMATVIEAFLKTGNLSVPTDSRSSKVQVDPSRLSFQIGPSMDATGKFSAAEAKQEAERCVLCQCDSCKIYCDIVSYTGKWPIRIKDEVHATMQEGQADVKPIPAKRLINTCTHCGLCEEVCPSHIDMDSMLMEARKGLHQLNRMPWAFHDFWLRDMEFANGDWSSLVRKPMGTTQSKYAFFPGCQLGASEPRYVEETYQWLLGHEPDMALFLKCCGIPVKWSGDEERYQKAIDELAQDWEGLGKPDLVVACPTCMNQLSSHFPGAKVISLYEFMEERGGLTPADNGNQGTWSIFDPCATTGKSGIRQAVREIAKKAKVKLEPLPIQEAHSACCSYGGHVATANRDYADYVVDKRIKESENPYITYCINCRDAFLGAGKKTLHILDLLFGDGGYGGHAPLATVTERRHHRVALKKQLLKEYWGEEMEEYKPEVAITLTMSDEVRAKLNRERILEEEIAAVIEFCERTGRKISLVERGTISGYRQIGYMTYWVEYQKVAEGFELVNAYCHRMKIELEAVWNGRKTDLDV